MAEYMNEQIKHIVYYAHYKHLPIRVAEIEWVTRFARLFHDQYVAR